MPDLSERLIQLKMKKNLLQKDIAKNNDISLRAYRYYETGERKPDSDTIIKLCNYFNVSADYLLGLSDDITSDDDNKILSYYKNLNEKNKDLIKGEMVKLHKEQEAADNTKTQKKHQAAAR